MNELTVGTSMRFCSTLTRLGRSAIAIPGKIVASLLILFLASGCATNPDNPITFSPESLRASGEKVGVLVEKIPDTNTAFPGADCLLCLAAANLTNERLTAKVRTLDHENIDNLADKFIAALKKTGIDASSIAHSDSIDALSKFKGDGKTSAKKDYRSLKEAHSLDKLIVVRVYGQGVMRPYSSYIPNDVPRAYVDGIAFMVDLETNNYLWYRAFEKQRAAVGDWKEPPEYPGLTNAYYQTVAEVSDRLVTAFLSDEF